MIGLWILLLLAFNLNDSIHRVARMNQYSTMAAQAYGRKEYRQAIAAYAYLRDTLTSTETKVALNLAHAYRQAGEKVRAQEIYTTLTGHADPTIVGSAYLNLGILKISQGEATEGLRFFRLALVREPGNQTARYNYELVKKYLLLHPQTEAPERQEPQSQDPTPPPSGLEASQKPQPNDGPTGDAQGNASNNSSPQPTENTNSNSQNSPSKKSEPEGAGSDSEPAGKESGDTQGTTPAASPPNNDRTWQAGNETISEKDIRAQTINRNLQELNLSQEKAEMLLQALKEAEMQQIQQLPRKSNNKGNYQRPNW